MRRQASTTRLLFASFVASTSMAALALFAPACGHGAATNYGGAASFAAEGAGLTALDRKLTGDCWGQCLNGLVCDHQRGVCVERAPCGGRCAPTERCREGTVDRCEPILAGVEAREAGTD
jgi:hypothetical protein